MFEEPAKQMIKLKDSVTDNPSLDLRVPILLVNTPCQQSQVKVNTETVAVMGATLANGGICPTTGLKVVLILVIMAV